MSRHTILRAGFRKLGLCGVCGKNPESGYMTCRVCLDRSKKTRLKHKAKGLCGCGNTAVKNRKKCTDCLALANQRVATFLAAGLCYCGKHAPRDRYALCESCLKKRKVRSLSMKAAGKCVCGRITCKEFSLCARCRSRAGERMKGMISDKAFAFLSRIRDCIYKSIKKRRKYRKAGRSEYILGCTYDFAHKHIENQFLPRMSWDNMDSWHIDHHIPCSFFDLSDERQQRICNNWRNLKPMWATDNLSKKDKLPKDWKERLSELEMHVPHLDPMNDPMFR